LNHIGQTSWQIEIPAGLLPTSIAAASHCQTASTGWNPPGIKFRDPSGAHHIALMRNSVVVSEAVPAMVGHPRAIAPENIANLRVQLLELLTLLNAEMEGKEMMRSVER
jgi:hypothetical protein